jgi:ABC-type Mn2+/Zn2+ transport system permease subunit
MTTVSVLQTVAAAPSPLDLVDLPFMRTATAEVLLLAVAGGLLGAWIVLRRLAFFAHAVGGATFPGLVVADATGIRPIVAALAVALAYAAGVHRAGSRSPGGRAADAATGLLLVAALALGVILASDVFASGARVDRLLFGTLLGLDSGDLAAAGGAAALALLATVLLGPAWLASGFDREGARTLGAPVGTADALLLVLVAVAVVTALPAVGALLTTSLFIVPAATARLVARSVPQLLVASVALAAAEGLIGVYVALWADAPPGPAIAVLGAAVYALTALACELRGRGRARNRGRTRRAAAPA